MTSRRNKLLWLGLGAAGTLGIQMLAASRINRDDKIVAYAAIRGRPVMSRMHLKAPGGLTIGTSNDKEGVIFNNFIDNSYRPRSDGSTEPTGIIDLFGVRCQVAPKGLGN